MGNPDVAVPWVYYHTDSDGEYAKATTGQKGGLGAEEGSGAINFLQYYRPDGHTRWEYINRPMSIAQLAAKLEVTGCRFEAEVLSNGTISLTVMDSTADGGNGQDIDIELSPNDPTLPEHVDKLIERAYHARFPTA